MIVDPSNLSKHGIEILKATSVSQHIQTKAIVTTSLIQGLSKNHSQEVKLLSKLVAICISLKQKKRDFDLSLLMKTLFGTVFDKSHKAFMEFNLKIALGSKNESKQALALATL